MKKRHFTITCLIVIMMQVLVACSPDNSSDLDPTPTDPRAKFAGNWSVNETWTKLNYVVTITIDDGTGTGVWISNFANTGSSGLPALAYVSDNNITLAGPDQSIGEGLIVKGGGTISGTNKINWNYTINDGATLFTAVAVYTKL